MHEYSKGTPGNQPTFEKVNAVDRLGRKVLNILFARSVG